MGLGFRVLGLGYFGFRVYRFLGLGSFGFWVLGLRAPKHTEGFLIMVWAYSDL